MKPAKGSPGGYLACHLRPGDRVIDVGANLGAVTRVLLKTVGPTGTVIAIEPDPRCQEALSSLVATHPCLRVSHVALADQDGATDLHLGEGSMQSSLRASAVKHPAGTTPVHVCCLDAYQHVKPHAVKIDAQGAEGLILAGATQLLLTCPRWVLEMWPFGLAQFGTTPDDIWDRMARAGLTAQFFSTGTDTMPAERSVFETWAARALSREHEHEHLNMVWTRE